MNGLTLVLILTCVFVELGHRYYRDTNQKTSAIFDQEGSDAA